MPYVPSEKTVPPAEDRKILDPIIELVAQEVATRIKNNRLLKTVYRGMFLDIAIELEHVVCRGGKLSESVEAKLAFTIYEVANKWGYDGAESGELNYSVTRIIQRVPQIKVERGEWENKDELRYWSYAAAVRALICASRRTEDFVIDASGVYEDVKDEYKWRVNRPYEAAQIIKSGDCYDTPYYTKLVEVVDENGKLIGHTDVYLKRSEETLHKDVLDYQLVLRKKPSS